MRSICPARPALLVGLLALAAASTASASVPMSIFVSPTKVELPPGTNTVVIHGAFTRIDKNGNYGLPMCGYMYFECIGDGKTQTMCQMQWAEIQAAVHTLATFQSFVITPWKPLRTLSLTPGGAFL